MGIYDRETYDLVIIGGGPAGLSAALYGARSGMRETGRSVWQQ